VQTLDRRGEASKARLSAREDENVSEACFDGSVRRPLTTEYERPCFKYTKRYLTTSVCEDSHRSSKHSWEARLREQRALFDGHVGRFTHDRGLSILIGKARLHRYLRMPVLRDVGVGHPGLASTKRFSCGPAPTVITLCGNNSQQKTTEHAVSGNTHQPS
jgi:hypothetical protein